MREIWAAAGLAALAPAVPARGSPNSSSSAASTPAAGASSPAAPGASADTVLSTTINGTQVRANSTGFTLHWFALDTSTTAKRTGSCATSWPPVTGPVTAGSVTGTLGTITTPDGTTQATYDGHPLYTYAGDTAPGQANGSKLTASGRLRYEMTISGATPAASTSTSGGGY